MRNKSNVRDSIRRGLVRLHLLQFQIMWLYLMSIWVEDERLQLQHKEKENNSPITSLAQMSHNFECVRSKDSMKHLPQINLQSFEPDEFSSKATSSDDFVASLKSATHKQKIHPRWIQLLLKFVTETSTHVGRILRMACDLPPTMPTSLSQGPSAVGNMRPHRGLSASSAHGWWDALPSTNRLHLAHGWNGLRCRILRASPSLRASLSLWPFSRFLWTSSSCARESGGSGKTVIRHRERGRTRVPGRRRQGCHQRAVVERLGSGCAGRQGWTQIGDHRRWLPIVRRCVAMPPSFSRCIATERPVWMVHLWQLHADGKNVRSLWAHGWLCWLGRSAVGGPRRPARSCDSQSEIRAKCHETPSRASLTPEVGCSADVCVCTGIRSLFVGFARLRRWWRHSARSWGGARFKKKTVTQFGEMRKNLSDWFR